MDRFLVNMAIVRVNINHKGFDILDNYIPLVHETLDVMNSDIFSLDEFKKKFVEISEFSIPTGALVSLLNRASKKHEILEKQPNKIYKVVKNNIKQQNYLQVRDREQRRYQNLIMKFINFCKAEHNTNISEEEVSDYFFEVLYELAPKLFMNLNSEYKHSREDSSQNKFLVSKFISYVNQNDNEAFEAILSFVKGSMLTETFYYSQKVDDIQHKPLRKVVVYLDTQFLIRVLGFSEPELRVPCEELLEMLRDMNVKVRCFQDTFNEINGILNAALIQLNNFGRLNPNKPSDVFDYFNKKDISSADLLVLIDGLEDKLNKIGVYVEQKPDIIEVYSINEAKLSEVLSDAFENQSDKARQHDIDCLQAVFQMREGRKQDYLDRCKAIFITTNGYLANISTKFFNDEYGHSNAPICMADYVFTSLVWMKSIKKIQDIPKDRLVANCYSALLPSDSLWASYIDEVNKLKESNQITENDYHLLIHSMAAREHLVEQSYSMNDNIVGSVSDILRNAKREFTKELTGAVDELSSQLEEQKQEVNKQKIEVTSKDEKIEKFSSNVRQKFEITLVFVLSIMWAFFLVYALTSTSPDSLSNLKNFEFRSIVFLTLVVLTVLNLLFGFRILDIIKKHVSKAGLKIENKLLSILK